MLQNSLRMPPLFSAWLRGSKFSRMPYVSMHNSNGLGMIISHTPFKILFLTNLLRGVWNQFRFLATNNSVVVYGQTETFSSSEMFDCCWKRIHLTQIYKLAIKRINYQPEALCMLLTPPKQQNVSSSYYSLLNTGDLKTIVFDIMNQKKKNISLQSTSCSHKSEASFPEQVPRECNFDSWRLTTVAPYQQRWLTHLRTQGGVHVPLQDQHESTSCQSAYCARTARGLPSDWRLCDPSQCQHSSQDGSGFLFAGQWCFLVPLSGKIIQIDATISMWLYLHIF